MHQIFVAFSILSDVQELCGRGLTQAAITEVNHAKQHLQEARKHLGTDEEYAQAMAFIPDPFGCSLKEAPPSG